MELKAEQIKKALEWCSSDRNCIECLENDKNPRLSKEGCMAVQMRNALALITSQEQRIKELTKKFEAGNKEYIRLDAEYRSLNAKYIKLTEENERLREKADRAYENLKAVLEERKGESDNVR